MFYVIVLLICVLIGAFVTVGALVDPNVVPIGLAVLVVVPLAGMLVGDVIRGEIFNPLVACIVAVIAVPIICLPPHVVALALLSIWSILVVALVLKTALTWARRILANSGIRRVDA